MQLVEVLLQGVRGAPALTRWGFPAGAAVVPAGAREELVARAAFEMLACAADGALPAAVLSASEGGSQARAGVVVAGRDQRRFRLLWDLSSGRRALQVQSGDAWTIVSTTTNEIAQALTAMVGVPQADALREVLFSFTDDLPSRRIARTERAASGRAMAPTTTTGPTPPGFVAAPTQAGWTDRTDAELQQRLDALRARAAAHDEVSALEFELGGLQRNAFELDAKLKPLQEGSARLAALREDVARSANLDPLARDFPSSVAQVRQGTSALQRQLKQLDEDERRIYESAAALPAAAYARQRNVGAIVGSEGLVTNGLVAGIGAIALAAVGSLFDESLRYLALLDIPAFGVAVIGGFRVLAHLEDGAAVRDRLARVAALRAQETERGARERERLDRLLVDAGFEPGRENEVEVLLRHHLERRARLRHAEDQQRAAEDDAQLAGLRAQRDELTRRISALEQRLQLEGTKFDAQAIEHERERREIEAVLQARAAPGGRTGGWTGGWTGGRTGGGRSGEDEGAVGMAANVDVGQRIVHAAADLFATKLDDACARLSPRASQIVAALLGQRFVEVRFGARGECELVDAATRAPTPFARLPAMDRDLAAMALRLAVLEASARRERLPLVVDRAFDHLLLEQLPLLTRALQFIGQSTQVICLTTRRELAGVGPVVAAVVGA
jgi:hypothetical protein